jgi:hypothetical protein
LLIAASIGFKVKQLSWKRIGHFVPGRNPDLIGRSVTLKYFISWRDIALVKADH